jgi:hypothetical protein
MVSLCRTLEIKKEKMMKIYIIIIIAVLLSINCKKDAQREEATTLELEIQSILNRNSNELPVYITDPEIIQFYKDSVFQNLFNDEVYLVSGYEDDNLILNTLPDLNTITFEQLCVRYTENGSVVSGTFLFQGQLENTEFQYHAIHFTKDITFQMTYDFVITILPAKFTLVFYDIINETSRVAHPDCAEDP